MACEVPSSLSLLPGPQRLPQTLVEPLFSSWFDGGGGSSQSQHDSLCDSTCGNQPRQSLILRYIYIYIMQFTEI